MTAPQSWLPEGFAHPMWVGLETGHHLRPIRGDDVELDYPAVMGCRERLWARYGAAWGWPPATMTVEQDREDLDRHAREIDAHEAFNYAVLDAGAQGGVASLARGDVGISVRAPRPLTACRDGAEDIDWPRSVMNREWPGPSSAARDGQNG
jgi:hypothetical protein